MKKNLMMALVAVSIATSAWADSRLAPADSSRVYDLDEVVVVSQSKEYAKLRQQPLSSTVLTGNEIGSLGVRDLREISDFVPSFVMPNYGARFTSSIYVRGIGSRVNSPSMGIYVDDIPLMNKSAFNSHTWQLDRVDVLRGPQGTLYGVNTEGGLVRQYTKNPLRYQGTDIKLGIGTHFYRNAEVAHYQKLSEKHSKLMNLLNSCRTCLLRKIHLWKHMRGILMLLVQGIRLQVLSQLLMLSNK